jgi:hypothetical protein
MSKRSLRPIVLRRRYRFHLAPLLRIWEGFDEEPYTSVEEGLSDRSILRLFLQSTQKDKADPSIGWVDTSYTHDVVGGGLVDAGVIRHSRLYATPYYSCCFSLPKHLRLLALERFYVEIDDSKSFHRIALSHHERFGFADRGREMLQRICDDADLYPMIAKHYRVAPSVIKEGVHRISNDGKLSTWRTSAGIHKSIPDHPFMVDWRAVSTGMTDFLRNRHQGVVDLIRGRWPTKRGGRERTPELTLKSYLLQEQEAHALLVKMRVCKKHAVEFGPGCHDGLAVDAHLAPDRLAVIIGEMESEILKETGVSVVLVVKGEAKKKGPDQ